MIVLVIGARSYARTADPVVQTFDRVGMNDGASILLIRVADGVECG